MKAHGSVGKVLPGIGSFVSHPPPPPQPGAAVPTLQAGEPSQGAQVAAATLGLLALPVVAWSEYTLHSTGARTMVRASAPRSTAQRATAAAGRLARHPTSLKTRIHQAGSSLQRNSLPLSHGRKTSQHQQISQRPRSSKVLHPLSLYLCAQGAGCRRAPAACWARLRACPTWLWAAWCSGRSAARSARAGGCRQVGGVPVAVPAMPARSCRLSMKNGPWRWLVRQGACGADEKVPSGRAQLGVQLSGCGSQAVCCIEQ